MKKKNICISNLNHEKCMHFEIKPWEIYASCNKAAKFTHMLELCCKLTVCTRNLNENLAISKRNHVKISYFTNNYKNKSYVTEIKSIKIMYTKSVIYLTKSVTKNKFKFR